MNEQQMKKGKLNKRQQTLVTLFICLFLFAGMIMSGFFIGDSKLGIQLDMKNMKPSFKHLFGTDWLGRDMFARTLKGLTLSLTVGIVAAFSSTVLALILSLFASLNKTFDFIVTWLIDLFLSVPHIVTLILISFTLGGGFKGIIVGLALTHWPRLTRLLRSEILQIKETAYVGVSRCLGQSKLWIVRNHFIPHVVPHLLVGFVLLFPHAILHEAAITFLGFGLPAETPAIGVILSEAMQYLSTGMWWLAFFPGLSLLIMVGTFDLIGRSIRQFIDPFHGQRG